LSSKIFPQFRWDTHSIDLQKVFNERIGVAC